MIKMNIRVVLITLFILSTQGIFAYQNQPPKSSILSEKINISVKNEPLLTILNSIFGRLQVKWIPAQEIRNKRITIDLVDVSLKTAIVQVIKKAKLKLQKKGHTYYILLQDNVADLSDATGTMTVNFQNTRVDLALKSLFQGAGRDCILHQNLADLKISGNFKDTPIRDIILVILKMYDLEMEKAGGIYSIRKSEK
jgi:type II secretory pathway component GspD/PulD (secretin)